VRKRVMDRCRKIRKVVSFDRRRTDTRAIMDQRMSERVITMIGKRSSSEPSEGSLLFFGGKLLVYSADH